MNEISMHRYIAEDIIEVIFNSASIMKEAAVSFFAKILKAAQSMAQSGNVSAMPLSASRASERAGLLLDKYGNNILRVAYSYLHNMRDAEDILQDTLIQYMRKAPEFENENH